MTAYAAATAATLPEVAWRVSTRSGSGGGNCVEAGPVLDSSSRVAVRDSKDRTGPVLVYPTAAWITFLTTLHTTFPPDPLATEEPALPVALSPHPLPVIPGEPTGAADRAADRGADSRPAGLTHGQ